MKMEGKTALITGGARGLGRGFAEALLEEGGKVALVDLLLEEGLKTAAELNEQYGAGRAFFIRCDVTQEDQLRNAFETTKQCYGHIDLVANNAGVAEIADWRPNIEINLVAVLRGCEIALEYMSKDNGGRGGLIINTSSTAGLTAVPFTAYAAAKHGVVGVTRSYGMREDVSADNIRVCCLCPSFTYTPMVYAQFKVTEEELAQQPFIRDVGIMRVPEVVNAFMKIVEWDDLQGGVVVVTPKGIKVQYPRKYKARL